MLDSFTKLKLHNSNESIVLRLSSSIQATAAATAGAVGAGQRATGGTVHWGQSDDQSFMDHASAKCNNLSAFCRMLYAQWWPQFMRHNTCQLTPLDCQSNLTWQPYMYATAHCCSSMHNPPRQAPVVRASCILCHPLSLQFIATSAVAAMQRCSTQNATSTAAVWLACSTQYSMNPMHHYGRLCSTQCFCHRACWRRQVQPRAGKHVAVGRAEQMRHTAHASMPACQHRAAACIDNTQITQSNHAY